MQPQAVCPLEHSQAPPSLGHNRGAVHCSPAVVSVRQQVPDGMHAAPHAKVPLGHVRAVLSGAVTKRMMLDTAGGVSVRKHATLVSSGQVGGTGGFRGV